MNIYLVNDYMKTKGWRFNIFQFPLALHFCVTRPQRQVPGIAGQMTADLKAGVQYVRDNAGKDSDARAVYGISGNLEGNRMVRELLEAYLDLFYTV